MKTKVKAKIQVKTLRKLIAVLVLFTSFAQTQTLSTFDQQLLNLQQQWAKVNYTLNEQAQLDGFDTLVEQANDFVKENPSKAEPLVWYGIIQSSYAGAKGGIKALSHAKSAKGAFESAMKIDEEALDGSAFTSLGVLYHKVPGWPIGFGSDKKAKQLLDKAIAINPKGIDSNYFYAEYLFDEGAYSEAKVHLMTALDAPARNTRPLADESRRAEIQVLLTKVKNKMDKSS